MGARKWKGPQVVTSLGDEMKAVGLRLTHPKTEEIRQTHEKTRRNAEEAQARVKQRVGFSERFIPISTLPVASSFKK